MTKKYKFSVEGMHCASCELLIERSFSKLQGVKKVNAKLGDSTVEIESELEYSPKKLSSIIEPHGYKILTSKKSLKAYRKKDLILGFVIAVTFFGLFLLLQKVGIINLVDNSGQITLPFVFLIGVVASLSTCMAVVGGLVLSLSSSYAKNRQVKPMIIFHISRIVGFFVLGGLIGLLGSAFIITPIVNFALNLLLFFVMAVIAVNLLEVFPAAKNLQLKMPKFIGKRVLKIEDSSNFLTPVLLGAATFFLPCGFTQSMQLYSLSTGSFLNGAITMFVFALGTFPVLAFISFISSKFSGSLKSGLFFKTAGFIILLFAVFNFIAALVAIGIIEPIFNL